MREVKFRIRWMKDGKIFTRIFDWGMITSGIIYDGKLISRDQFTGLKDKNGKEIYEGDIAKIILFNVLGIPIEKVNEIIFRSGCFGITEKEQFKSFEEFIKEQVEVIGNIYENPELLK